MRTIHRAFRRAELPITYSQGFNPHPSISVSAPLTLGISSLAEYADIDMDTFFYVDIMKEQLNNNLPHGIKILNIIHIKEKMPTSMSVVNGAEYSIKLKMSDDNIRVGEIINKILNMQEINIMKRSKSGEKLTDVRKMINNLAFKNIENGLAEIICRIDTGSKSSLSPEYAANIIKEYSDGKLYGYADICRLAIFTEKNNKWIDLDSYFAGK
jgi:radical SAM-linked protein